LSVLGGGMLQPQLQPSQQQQQQHMPTAHINIKQEQQQQPQLLPPTGTIGADTYSTAGPTVHATGTAATAAAECQAPAVPAVAQSVVRSQAAGGSSTSPGAASCPAAGTADCTEQRRSSSPAVASAAAIAAFYSAAEHSMPAAAPAAAAAAAQSAAVGLQAAAGSSSSLAARAEQLALGLGLLQQWVAGDVAAMQQQLRGQGVADGAQGHSLLQVRQTGRRTP
jgi:hypothetical protein